MGTTCAVNFNLALFAPRNYLQLSSSSNCTPKSKLKHRKYA
jgi:hypothetical protein